MNESEFKRESNELKLICDRYKLLNDFLEKGNLNEAYRLIDVLYKQMFERYNKTNGAEKEKSRLELRILFEMSSVCLNLLNNTKNAN